MNNKYEEIVKKQTNEIAELKKAILMLQRVTKKLQVQVTRNKDNVRRAHIDIGSLTKNIRNLQ